MKGKKTPTRKVDFVINEEDLPPAPISLPFMQEGKLLFSETDSDILVVSLEDLLNVGPSEVICIGAQDLAEIDRQVIRITAKDLPPIIKIGLRDLPPDLSYMTTECYHGTSMTAAKQIERQGFRVGSGMASGAGIYFAVGAVGCSKGYAKSSNPCIIRARINWGKVAYLDDPRTLSAFKGGGRNATEAALKKGYDSFILNKKFSTSSPTIGIVLGREGTYIKPPRIEVIEILDPHSGKRKK